MRVGKFDRTVSLMRRVPGGTNNAGVKTVDWAPVGSFRAQLIDCSTEEFARAYGERTEALVIFRTWYRPIGFEDRLAYGDKIYDVKQVKEIGRRQWIEIRAVAVPRTSDNQ